MAPFAKIGVGAGRTFDTAALSPAMKAAIGQGMADAWQALAGVQKEMDAGNVTTGDLLERGSICGTIISTVCSLRSGASTAIPRKVSIRPRPWMRLADGRWFP
jgi:hypothetical protein